MTCGGGLRGAGLPAERPDTLRHFVAISRDYCYSPDDAGANAASFWERGKDMNIPRSFILVGIVYLVLGVLLGMYMGASGKHAAAPAHAHINLLGFTLMMIFGITYKVFPAMAAHRLAVIHFGLHLVGSVVLLSMLFMLVTGRIGEASMAPIAPTAELLVLLGVLAFLWNAIQNAK